MAKYIDLKYVITPKKHIVRTIICRFLICLGLLVGSFLILFFGATTIICYGPSPSARDLFVTTTMETSAAKFLAKIYFSDKEIDDIIKKNAPVITDEVTDENLIDIPTISTNVDQKKEPIEVFDISGLTYKGKVMIISDPSRVVITAPTKRGLESEGVKIDKLVANEGGVAGINAGGFVDVNGVGNGGQPLGILIKNGEVLSGLGKSAQNVVGFDKENKLIVGYLTAKECLDKNIRDAVSFGPIFIVNGKRVEVAGSGGGLNPRTCIGQTKDGSVIFLTIDGRQAGSLGANFEDCINVLEEYGAVNAANLDGGSSTVMYYNGKVINMCCSVYGPRKLPSAFVVK